MDLFATSPLPAASSVSSREMHSFASHHSYSSPRKTRLACDRCHLQKLRCVRKAEQSCCQRCMKLKTRCRFGPRTSISTTQPKVPTDPSIDVANTNNDLILTSNAETAVVNGREITQQLDLDFPVLWTDVLNADNSLFLDPTSPADSMNNYWTGILPPHELTTEASSLPMSSIERIARLNVALYNCSSELPSISKPTGPHITKIHMHETHRIFAFDKLFNLTTEFIDSVKYQVFDEATVLMVLSCYHRLTEIYISIFEMMQICIKHSLPPDMSNNWVTILPQLQIGSFAASPVQVDINTPLSSETSLMYMLTITMVSSQLWGKLENLLRMHEDIPGTLEAKIWKSMEEETSRMCQTISSTKHILHTHSGAV